MMVLDGPMKIKIKQHNRNTIQQIDQRAKTVQSTKATETNAFLEKLPFGLASTLFPSPQNIANLSENLMCVDILNKKRWGHSTNSFSRTYLNQSKDNIVLVKFVEARPIVSKGHQLLVGCSLSEGFSAILSTFLAILC